MEEEHLFNEKDSIRSSTKLLKKYGSTSNRNHRQEDYIKHPVQKHETLQGISLKYGVSTELVRRTNRLFASDSLFLREFLLIPCNKDTPFYAESEIVTEIPSKAHRASIAGFPDRQQSPSSPDEKETFSDFLTRVDSSLASIKIHVEKTKESSMFATDLVETPIRQRPVARLRQSSSMGGPSISSITSSALANLIPNASLPYQQIPTEEPFNSPVSSLADSPPLFVPKNVPTKPIAITAPERRLITPLERLERSRDNIFQF